YDRRQDHRRSATPVPRGPRHNGGELSSALRARRRPHRPRPPPPAGRAPAPLRGMVAPGLRAVGMPVAVGLIFRFARDAEVTVGGVTYPDSSGWLAVSGMLMIGTIGGIILATFFNNVGGAWDNAKKYIEAGMLQVPSENPGAMTTLGKGTDAHKAAVVGDTVGDPYKDTAGPSLHVLGKLLSTIT